MIHLSKSAAAEIQRMKLSRNKPDSILRLQVNQGGCSGLFYSLELESVVGEDELNNYKTRSNYYEAEGIPILIDDLSQTYLKEIKLDYSEDLMGGGFRFKNARATKTCRCGLSFAISDT